MDIKEIKKKINFKEKRYTLPLIVLIPLLYLVYNLSGFLTEKPKEKEQEFLSTSLGIVEDTIADKNTAYDKFYKNDNSRTMIQTIGEEELDSIKAFRSDFTDAEKRYIDSLDFIQQNLEKQNRNKVNQRRNGNESFYKPKNNQDKSDEEDYERSMKIMRMLNDQGSEKQEDNRKEEEEVNPLKLMREQFLLLDSLEKSKDPKLQAMMNAQAKLKANQKLKEDFLNSSFEVKKGKSNPNFNTIAKEQEISYIKAVIDEDIKGYLGSRIRFRLLDDVWIAGQKVKKGEILYANISGFQLQRVNLNIVSVLVNGEILPVNLTVYDIDGMKGLYVPRSLFREMVKELGQSSIQGTTMSEGGTDFFQSAISKAFTSTSRMIANLIRKNKAKLKYNSYIYLINEKELKKNEN